VGARSEGCGSASCSIGLRQRHPNGAGLPRWPVFAVAGAQVLQLGDPIAVGGVPELPALQVFDAVYAHVRGAPVPVR
jgi:hypothetical protein